MPELYAIAAISENRALAFQDKLPWHLPLEYRWFKHKTMGGTLIMGRKTREAIGRALPGRTNLVLSRGEGTFPETRCYPGFETLMADLPADRPAWVVGGAEIYRQLFPRCARLYLSRIKRVTEGDVFLPPFEDQFVLDQTIHDNPDFRVECWRRLGEPPLPPEPWPF
jgi:dihydrofolate reductase